MNHCGIDSVSGTNDSRRRHGQLGPALAAACVLAVGSGCGTASNDDAHPEEAARVAVGLIEAEDCMAGSVNGKVGICHATGVATAPYAHIRVSTRACINGHSQHGDDFVSDDPACVRCMPTTCANLGASCGTVADGCGGTLDCGTCTAPQSCGGAGTPNVCGAATCTPRLVGEDWITFRSNAPTFFDGKMILGGPAGASAVRTRCEFSPPVTLTWRGCMPSVTWQYVWATLAEKSPLDPFGWEAIVTPSLGVTVAYDKGNMLQTHATNNAGTYFFGRTNTQPSGSYFCGEFQHVWGADRVAIYLNGELYFEASPQAIGMQVDGPLVVAFQGQESAFTIEQLSIQ